MDKVGKNLARKIKSSEGSYELMVGTNFPARIETKTKFHEYDIDVGMSVKVTKVDTVEPTFTVSDAVDRLGFGKFQIMVSCFTGLCWMADSMELTTLSLLPPALHCSFCITDYQQASLSTVVFVGMMLSAPIFGTLSDRYGRRTVLWYTFSFLFLFGALSAFSTSYYSLLTCRFFVGVAAGSIPQSLILYTEFLPCKDRARCITLLSVFWTVGSSFEVLLALVVMPTLGWEWLLGFSSLPILFFVLVCYWLPESVRFLAVSGQSEKAYKTLEKIAKDNKEDMLKGRLVADEKEQRGRFLDLLTLRMRLTTLLLWFIWVAAMFCALGIALLSIEILEQIGAKEAAGAKLHELHTSKGNVQPDITLVQPSAGTATEINQNGFANGVCDTGKPCRVLTRDDYLDLFWIGLSEFPGIIITILMMDRIGRKKTMGILFFLFSVTIAAFMFKIEGRRLITFLLFMARLLISAVFHAAAIYTPEVYPTSMRAVGMGATESVSRIGAIVSPYVAQVLARTSLPLAAGCYAAVALLAAIFAMLLPYETKEKAMPD